ncbi:major facilitator superfamily domain-containing protein 6-like [Trichoplusia ni]|uniref:Major facilitator superfamily domain-containing protein 6-like n=1 Tax=Trichoplusia ni TaxID=7111 RepID=A0A7E5VB71_TRINI|nr:major facilitator superfamily domain-containing protein 6-like [Trichoplusia ni]
MKFKIDKGLLPIKAHFFFFFAALGPILPQINVYGRQLGVSPAVMGLVTAVLPLLWATAKPLFGYVVDFWPAQRKLVFMLLIIVMTSSYCGLWFLPMPDPQESNDTKILESVYKLNNTIYLKQYQNDTNLEKYKCHWNCTIADHFEVYLSSTPFINTIYIDNEVSNKSCSTLSMDLNDFQNGDYTCIPKENCDLLCYEIDLVESNRTKRSIEKSTMDNVLVDFNKNDSRTKVVVVENSDSFYMTGTFWAFVILMCVGTVAFNVANCIGDAVCFDVLGPDRGSKYGAQRAWGTVGYGATALLGGWLIDVVSGEYKDFTPAFILALIATAVDLYSCRKLTLPSLSSPEDSGKALRDVLKIPKVIVFIIFAVVAGTFDSFIIYYMFWFLEELAEQTGHTAKIKLIEGIVIAAESFLGELVFFSFSGKIIKRLGYGTTLTVSLLFYGLRMVCISLITNPWHLVVVSALLQGPTYALCYSTIVGYAAAVAPEGYSATVQGIVAGMDDGVGFAIGSLVGGQLYSWLGGRGSFRVMAVAAILGSGLHAVLFAMVSRSDERKAEKSAPESIPEEGVKMLQEHSNAIYQDTVVPLNSETKDDR